MDKQVKPELSIHTQASCMIRSLLRELGLDEDGHIVFPHDFRHIRSGALLDMLDAFPTQPKDSTND